MEGKERTEKKGGQRRERDAGVIIIQRPKNRRIRRVLLGVSQVLIGLTDRPMPGFLETRTSGDSRVKYVRSGTLLALVLSMHIWFLGVIFLLV